MKSTTNMQDPEHRTLNAILAEQTPEQLQSIGIALAEAAAESQALLSEVMATSRPGETGSNKPDPFNMAGTYGKVGQALATNPQAMLSANLQLWSGWVDLWKDFTLGQIGNASDKRFSDPEWSSNPAFEFMRKAYELNSSWMMSLLDAAPDLSPADKRKAQFYTRQTVDALSPTNFFATNPAALRAMLKTGGQSLVDGLRNARADLARGGGRLSISQSDETPFEVGRNVATAPGKVIFRNELIELLRFEPTTKRVFERPLLIFPPWINKYYIMDLREENSLIRWLTGQGLTVMVVSWRSADEETRDYTWDDYVEKGAFAAIHEAVAQTGSDKVNAIGYCIGGTLLTSALGYMAKNGDDRVASATFFASQSDFSDAGDLMVFTDDSSLDAIDTVIEQNKGIMPGEMMGETFNWLRPVDLVWRYVVDNYMLGRRPRPFDLLFWNADQTNIPGKTHRTYLHQLYRNNELSSGTFKVLGETISMGDIDIPVTIQASREDHICPWHSIYRGAQKYSGDVNFILAGSGHIAGVINHPSAEKYQHWTNSDLPDTPEKWVTGAEETTGSWWPTWWTWLKPKCGGKTDARPVEDKGLGDAPGTYVKMRLTEIARGSTPASTYSNKAKSAKNPSASKKTAGKSKTKASASGTGGRPPKATPTPKSAGTSSRTRTKPKPKAPKKGSRNQGNSGKSASSPKD
jgi:polyhydroxyalkanoate synthase